MPVITCTACISYPMSALSLEFAILTVLTRHVDEDEPGGSLVNHAGSCKKSRLGILGGCLDGEQWT